MSSKINRFALGGSNVLQKQLAKMQVDEGTKGALTSTIDIEINSDVEKVLIKMDAINKRIAI